MDVHHQIRSHDYAIDDVEKETNVSSIDVRVVVVIVVVSEACRMQLDVVVVVVVRFFWRDDAVREVEWNVIKYPNVPYFHMLLLLLLLLSSSSEKQQ
jgi:hypothetical protein